MGKYLEEKVGDIPLYADGFGIIRAIFQIMCLMELAIKIVTMEWIKGL